MRDSPSRSLVVSAHLKVIVGESVGVFESLQNGVNNATFGDVTMTDLRKLREFHSKELLCKH